jgi:RPA family protein
MPEQKFKRHIAYKLRIGNVLLGKPILDEGRFSFLELGDKKIIRVNIIGNIVDRYESQSETNYISLTLDDGSGQIKLKVFGDMVEKFKDIHQGTTVVVIGLLRHWNDEIYISPDIIREADLKYLLLRKLETEKQRAASSTPLQKEQVTAVKDELIELIKSEEENGGIEVDKIIMKLQSVSPEIINQEIKKLLEEGIAFEPRPGKIRYLG